MGEFPVLHPTYGIMGTGVIDVTADGGYTIADGEPVPYNDCLREWREAEGSV